MKTRSLVWGFFLVAIGILFLLNQLGILPSGLNIMGLVFSLLMIILGLRWILKSYKNNSALSVQAMCMNRWVIVSPSIR